MPQLLAPQVDIRSSSVHLHLHLPVQKHLHLHLHLPLHLLLGLTALRLLPASEPAPYPVGRIKN